MKITDCEELDTEILIGTNVEFLAQEEWNEDYGTHIQLCKSSDRGGYGSDYCEVLPVEQLDDYLGAFARRSDRDYWSRSDRPIRTTSWPSDPRWDLQIQRSFH